MGSNEPPGMGTVSGHHPQPHPQPPSFTAAESRRRALAHSPDERHHPHIRRRRRRRVRRHMFLRRYGLVGVLFVVVAGFGAFVGGLWLAAWLLNSPAAPVLSAQEQDFSTIVKQTCEDTMLRVDCKCFWSRSKSAYTDTNLMALMMALTEREQWGPAITRGRMDKIAGPEATRTIGRALYDCVQM